MTREQDVSSITDRRKALGWSIYELRKRSGVNKWSTVRDAEQGLRVPQRSTLAKIEAALSAGEAAAAAAAQQEHRRENQRRAARARYRHKRGGTVEEEAG